MHPAHLNGQHSKVACRLASRDVACTAGFGRRRPNVAHSLYTATTICGAVSKQGGSGGRDAGEPAAGLVASLLRDAFAAVSTTSSPSPSGLRSTAVLSGGPLPEDLRSASYAIAAANASLFLLSAALPAALPAAALLLNHRQPAPWQLVTSVFAHPSLESLMQAVFFIYVFGRVVERTHGSLATWLVYVGCGAAAAALAMWLLPARGSAPVLSSAAPAAAWGLFLVGLALPRLTKKPLEVACLAPFALAATVARYAPLSSLLVADGAVQGQLVHVAGASMAAGLAALVLGAVQRWREEQERREREARRQAAAASQDEAISRVLNAASQAAQQLGKKLL